MAKLVLFNVVYLCGPADLTGQSNRIELDNMLEEKDTTNFASGGAKEVIAGIESTSIVAAGQWEAGDPGLIDDEMWASRRVIEPHTIGPDDDAAGDVAYFTQAVRTNAKLFGAVGDVTPWSLTAAGSYPLVRGVFLHPSATEVTGDGNGSAVQHAAVAAGQRLYGSAHMYSYTGFTSVAVTVQSDTVATFDGSAETRLTFDTFTDVGSDIQRTAIGEHLDDWYRVQFDVTGSGSALIVVAIGIA